MDERMSRPTKVRRTVETNTEETHKETLLSAYREHIPSPRSSSPILHDEIVGHHDRSSLPYHPHLSTPPSSGSQNLACELHVGDYVGSPDTGTSPTTIDATCDVGDNENDQTEKEAIAKATKNFRSECWKEFEPVLEDGVVVQARCKHCDKLMGAGRGQGTSALLTHLKRCKQRSSALKILQDLSSTLRSPDVRNWRYDPDVSRYELMRMISLHGVPFLFMEYDGFRRFISSLNPLFKVPCRTTVRNGCMKNFQEMKVALKDTLKNVNCRFSLTTDMWTSSQTLAYMVVTCHFIDAEWKLHKRIIQFSDVKTAHSGVELFNNILNCIQTWSIEHKLFGITLDNASSNNTMVDLLKHHLVQQKLIPVEGELLHHRCAGHIINLIVKKIAYLGNVKKEETGREEEDTEDETQ